MKRLRGIEEAILTHPIKTSRGGQYIYRTNSINLHGYEGGGEGMSSHTPLKSGQRRESEKGKGEGGRGRGLREWDTHKKS